jgi:hypothetical protein
VAGKFETILKIIHDIDGMGTTTGEIISLAKQAYGLTVSASSVVRCKQILTGKLPPSVLAMKPKYKPVLPLVSKPALSICEPPKPRRVLKPVNKKLSFHGNGASVTVEELMAVKDLAKQLGSGKLKRLATDLLRTKSSPETLMLVMKAAMKIGKKKLKVAADFFSLIDPETKKPKKASPPGKRQTVRNALDAKRKELTGKVTSLVLCKGELFYYPYPEGGADDSVYPVSRAAAQKEADHFGCLLQEA